MPLIETQPDAVAQVYAQSLFDLAAQQGQPQIESVLGELEEIVDMARADTRFGEFVSSRIVAGGDRDESLEKIFKGRVSDIVLNFLRLLNRKGRLGKITGIVAAYDRLVQNAFGRIEVDVYTPSPLSREDQDALARKLHETLGKEPVIHPYTDGSMIGGIRLQIGDQLIDASIATRLRKLRDQLATSGLPALRAAADRIIRASPSDNGH
jgi:F-type H+-transporting ATPase subunit delta